MYSIAFDYVSDVSHCARDSTKIRHDMTRPQKDILPRITRLVV